MDAPFDPAKVYLDLVDGCVMRPLPVDTNFWPEVMAGRTVIEGSLLSTIWLTGDMKGWERHPKGDEFLCLIDGAVDLVVESDPGERRFRLDTDNRSFLVPKNAWHRFLVPSPSLVLFITPGEGTEHKPL